MTIRMPYIRGKGLICWTLIFITSSATEGLLNRFQDVLRKRNGVTDCLNADFEAQCSTNSADCVAAMCDACQGVPVIAECCSLASVAAKLQCCLDAFNNPSELTMTGSFSTNAITTSMNSVSIPAMEGLEACGTVYTIRQSCQNQTTDFVTASFNQQASCLCYQAGTFDATVYDQAWSTCLAYASPTSPALYSSLTSLWGSESAPCSQAGPVRNLSIASSTSTWYIGYTTGTGFAPSSVSSDQPSSVVTATIAVATNGGHILSLSFVMLGVTGVLGFVLHC